MSWLARSLANSLRLEEDEEDDGQEDDVAPTDHPHPTSSSLIERGPQRQREDRRNETRPEEEAQSRGVKEDLTEFKQTLTRQLWGVASFLAPPPSQPSTPYELRHADRPGSDWNRSEPSDPAAVSNMDSNHGAYESEVEEEDDCGGAVGITEEVLAFARNIAMHPETWLDFPLDEEDDNDDFDLSDAQKEHAFTVERLAPRLAALRIELCPCHMSESFFWKVYFVLLHSRLDKHDAEFLYTPQVAEARAMWMQELQKQSKQESKSNYWFGRSNFHSKDRENTNQQDTSSMSSYNIHPDDRPYTLEPNTYSASTNDNSEKHQMESAEMPFVDKTVIVEKPVTKTEDKNVMVQNYEDDEEDWPDEGSDFGGCSRTVNPLVNEEDISFSDLEDDDVFVPIKPVSKEQMKKS